MKTPSSWDIFCRVVDNFGDAGVCWRLARRLAARGDMVRLWIDDLETLGRLHPGVAVAPEQIVEGIQVLDLRRECVANPAEVAIEAFGCGLPDPYAAAMAERRPQSLWIVLEYLSAESWVRQHHGLPSPHPRLALERYFFFPGFTEGTGGVLREPDLLARRDAFSETDRLAFWESIGHAPPRSDATVVSLFAYEMAPIGELLDVWERSPSPIVAVVAEARPLAFVLRHCGLAAVPSDRVVRRGALEIRVVPFVPQSRYDELLWSCDINFVRGEDSFVRAQWAGRPFVWQIYPQEHSAHRAKLEAFLDAYCEHAPPRACSAARALMRSWNGVGPAQTPLATAWSAFVSEQDELIRHTRAWARRVAAVGELTDNLVSFCGEKLK
ncbi:MAG: elongation factor P maturation arginine rhamnosyltransferase EarP [Burkholderiales bacterium]